MSPDPFAEALRHWRPSARPASVTRDAPSAASLDTSRPEPTAQRDEWSQPPLPHQCPTWRKVPGGADLWCLDVMGTPRQLLDGETGSVVIARGEAERDKIVKALRYEWRR